MRKMYMLYLARIMIAAFLAGSLSVAVRAQEMSNLTTEMQTIVAELRGLPFQQPIATQVESVAELQQVLHKELARAYPDDTLSNLAKRLFAFGFVASPINLRTMFQQLLSQQVAGYYDPYQKRMVLIDTTAGGGSQSSLFPLESIGRLFLKNSGISLDAILLAHELTHALQDQHFNLLALPFEELDPEDTTSAVKALIEGDATLVMFDYMLREQALDATHVPELSVTLRKWMESAVIRGFSPFRTIPRYVMDNLLFSYTYGFDFVLRLKQQGGWDRINRAYQQLPVSTEQILHPEKYLEAPDWPTTITLPPLSPVFDTWRLVEQNTLGELNVAILLDGYLTTDASKQAAASWDGDRFALYESPTDGKLFLAWYSVWDSAQEAQEFFQAYAAFFEKRYAAAPLMPNELIRSWTRDAGQVWLERRGTDVLLLDGVPAEMLDDIQAWAQGIQISR